jgi:cytochrome c-type biogenesis protein CcmH/NrfG
MTQQALRPRHAVVLALSFVLGAAALLATASSLVAQTADVWTNTKISDLRRHQQQIPSEAAEHYEIAQRYLVTIDHLGDKEDRSKRQQKKLDRAYEKGTAELEEAIDKAPDWIEPRMALAALQYKREKYEAARDQYREVLRLDPDNERAKSFLGTVEYYISRQDADQEEMQDDGGAPWEEGETGDSGEGSGER